MNRLGGAIAPRPRVVGLAVALVHHRLGDLSRVLTLPFEVERDAGGAPGG